MRVIKRNGDRVDVQFDKITQRLTRLCSPGGREKLVVDVVRVTAQACSGMHDNISTARLDELTADIACGLATEHPDYGLLAARILISNMHKTTSSGVLETYEKISHILSPDFIEVARTFAGDLQEMINYERDYKFDFFGYRTLEKMYLTKADGVVVERPQHMYLRVALALWGSDMARVKESYDALSLHQYTHASPTLFNAGTRLGNLSSCFLMDTEDSLDGIFNMFHDAARISKLGGGLGVNVGGVRSKGAPIHGTNGVSDGIIPMLRCCNDIVRYINQGGRRKGSMAVYISPHHPDIFEFLDLKKNAGEENLRARDIFLALWIPDLFMKRVETDAEWSLFDPSVCPGLDDVFGDAYEKLYAEYEAGKKASKVVKARDVFFEILRSQIETGTPYMLYKDSCNAKSNQQNLGVIKCSNLCTEILEYTSPEECAVCNLGSLSLSAFVTDKGFDLHALHAATKKLARALDRVIDVTYYPIEQARVSNMRHRPVGIGIQGLQDCFFMLKLPYESPEAAALHVQIFAAIYHAAIEESCLLAQELGPYSSFQGSPASRGKLQPDLWGIEPVGPWDWAGLRARVVEHGLRNSLSVAPMPTASTAQIFGNVESFEAITSNIYSRRTLAGEFVQTNKHLVNDLLQRGLWTTELKNRIVAHDGSVQGIGLPGDIEALYKTVWEMPMKINIDLAAARGPYICQSASLNLFCDEPTFRRLTSAHFHAWRSGLKTGMYYLRTKPRAKAMSVTTVQAPSTDDALTPSEKEEEPACLACAC